jgi:hypothetical protein
MNELWLILFAVVLLFDWFREQQYIFIYYTIWTFTLETIFFALLVAKKESYASKLFPFLFAPSIVVCVGFWVLIAPISISTPHFSNIVLTVVTHGLNMIAMILQPYKIYTKDIWKPILYTSVYNIFLAVYVGAGGRSISGKLPYWYAQYDKPVGWVFAGLSICAVSAVHALISTRLISTRLTATKKIEPFVV